ncbi:hypothetical protein C8Q74DRAFT_1367850 [Fomes fomentarius]|nr:hypothetical protein C8Q74DRAFT_1367850 [Fomes fomentarius]
MILLDGLDKHDQQSPKLVTEASSSFHPITRVQTPTPSLPDYEASQAQLRPTSQFLQLHIEPQDRLRPTTQSYSDINDKRTRRRRCRKWTLYVLTTYFLLSVVIGIPIIVVKMKHKSILRTANPFSSWEDNAPIPPKSITLGDAPLRISAAKSCNSWNVKDRPDGSMFLSELEYRIPVNGSVFLNTNITYASNTTYLNQFAGSLLVAVNDDATIPDGVVHVTMHHSTPALGNATHVCLMEAHDGDGLYLFAPKTLGITDALIFNITLLLPRNNSSPRNIPQLLCHLPHFQHTYNQLDPDITFGSVIFGGAMSQVYVESLQAVSAVVKASSAEIRGTFRVTQQLTLETVSAPINVDAHLYNYGYPTGPTFMRLTTGNSILNANVTLYLPQSQDNDNGSDSDDDDDKSYHPPGPQFYNYVETFNGPLNLAVTHDADSPTANMRLRATNNLGHTRVSLDSRYAGTFDVSTMFAQADVLTWGGTTFDGLDDDGDSDSDDDGDEDDASTSNASKSSTSAAASASASAYYDDDDDDDDEGNDNQVKKGTVRMRLPSLSTSTSTADGSVSTAGRCLEYDLISSSEIKGWVGTPPRPLSMGYNNYGNQSHVDLISSLNGVQLILQP